MVPGSFGRYKFDYIGLERLHGCPAHAVVVLNTIVPVVCLTVVALAIFLPHLGEPARHAHGAIQIDSWHRWGLAGLAAAALFVWARWFRR